MYIRTKDGIYEAKKNKVGAWITKLPYKIFDRDIIKQSKTIEELVDTLVYIVDGKPIIASAYNCVFLSCQEMLGKVEKIFGAIWTDKGLIYVAKMNESGALELL